jgi:hypothetical protein
MFTREYRIPNVKYAVENTMSGQAENQDIKLAPEIADRLLQRNTPKRIQLPADGIKDLINCLRK